MYNYTKQSLESFKEKLSQDVYASKTNALRALGGNHLTAREKKLARKLVTTHFKAKASTEVKLPSQPFETRPRRVRTRRASLGLVASRAPSARHEAGNHHRILSFLEWAAGEGMTLQELLDFMRSF